MQAMKSVILILLSMILHLSSLSLQDKPAPINAKITVMGFVYCDICSNNSFSRHSYFIPGVEVRIDCRFKEISPRTSEEITFSVNRTTNRYGVYKLDIPSVDEVACAEAAIASSCQASLVRSSSSSCNVPGFASTADQIAFKSKRFNVCIYSLNALTFRPRKRDVASCGHLKENVN